MVAFHWRRRTLTRVTLWFILALTFISTTQLACYICESRFSIYFEDNEPNVDKADYTVQIKTRKEGATTTCTFKMQVVALVPPYTEINKGCKVTFTLHSIKKADIEFFEPNLPEELNIEIKRGATLIVSQTITPNYIRSDGADGKQCLIAEERINHR